MNSMLEVMEDCSWCALSVYVRATLFWKLAAHSAQFTATRTNWSRATKIYFWKVASEWGVPKYDWRHTPRRKRKRMV